MSLLALAVVVLAVLTVGYTLYGRWVARQFSFDDGRTTPAHRYQDGIDFVPTRPFYLLGQHFSAIAAAGPIAGPILAAQQFGWLPAILWIGLGVVFIGAVHDVAALAASIRHEARSIAEVVKEHLGPRAGLVMMAFIWVALIYVIVAFTDVTASTFVSGDADTRGLAFRFNPGGAVAMASVLYLGLSVVMGLVERFLKPPLWLQTIIFVPATLVAVWAGTQLSTVMLLGAREWALLLLGYCFLASLTPVWALLQPRGYLGGFVLYLSLAVGVLGIAMGGLRVVQPAFIGWHPPGSAGTMFPFLFVTIACGACSGFHGLVCSGTTSKQIDRESHCHPVGYGAMLLEALVAFIALATVIVAAPKDLAGKAPGAIYGAGLGRFVAVLAGEKHLTFATTFGAMAFSTFVFDTLDVTARLGRYILQELTRRRGRAAAVVATAVTCGLPALFILQAGEGAWKSFWTLFGTSNQLLAALSLAGITVWLKAEGRKYLFVLLPAVGVSAVTLTSLVIQAASLLHPAALSTVQKVNGAVSAFLLALAVMVLGAGVRALFKSSSREWKQVERWSES